MPDGANRFIRSRRSTYQDLLASSVRAAGTLERLGLATGDRIILLLHVELPGACWIEAAKRLGIIYTCMPPNLPT